MHRHKLIIVIIMFIFISPFTMQSDVVVEIQDTNVSSIPSVSELPSGTNLSRVQWKSDHNPNHGFEDWQTDDPHTPDNLYTYRSTEQYTWYATNPWPVSQGLRSMGIQARAVDALHPSEPVLKQSTQVSKDNPVNLTLDFDYYIDENPNPVDSDHFYLYLRLYAAGQGYKYLYYYLSGYDTSKTNSSSYAYYELDQDLDIWHSFDRNITEDVFDSFSIYPTRYDYMEFKLHSETTSYSRAFVDDVNLVNGTNAIVSGSTNNGDFEGGGSWFISNRDPTDFSRTEIRKEGEYALNVTALSNGNRSQGHVSFDPAVRLTENNQDEFRFWWMIYDYQGASNNTHSYIHVQCSNATEEFDIYYILASGIESPVSGYEGLIEIEPLGYNTTGTWTFFNRSIWNDVTAHNATNEVVVEEIEIRIYTSNRNSRLSILVDDMVLESAALNDVGYEDQPTVGEEVRAWDLPDTNSYFTVTGDALMGDKAANLTVGNGDSFYEDQEIAYRPFNSVTETFLEMSWKLADFSSQVDEFAIVTISTDDNDFAYVFANGSTYSEGEGSDSFIILPNANSPNQWFTMQRNLVHDYEQLFGSKPNTTIRRIALWAETDVGGRIEILFDEVYIYDDIAPSISGISHDDVNTEVGEPFQVNASVCDLSLDTVQLQYRVDAGEWNSMTMSVFSDTFSAEIPGQEYGAHVEFFVSANDTFGKTTTGLNESVYFQYTVVDTLAPILQFVNPSDSATVSGTVEINASAIDDGSGLSVLVVFLDGEQLFNSTSSPKTFDWDTTTVENGEYILELLAYDIAGNSDSIEITVTVQNEATTTTTTGTTTDTTPPPLDLVPILIAVAVIAAIAVVVLYFVILKPRKT